MSGTTGNYAFPYPTNTDLVKNGAAAIQSLADSIDGFVSGSSGAGKLFQIFSDSSGSTQTTTSTSYVVKSDTSVTFTTGKSGMFAVVLIASAESSVSGTGALCGFDISGGYTMSPVDSLSVVNATTQRIQGSVAGFFDGTPSTSTTVSLAMKVGAGGATATCVNARLYVVTFG